MRRGSVAKRKAGRQCAPGSIRVAATDLRGDGGTSVKPEDAIAFRNLSGLVKWLKIALVALGLAALLDGYSSWLQIALLENAQLGIAVTKEAASANDSRQAWVGLLYFCAWLATAILFLRWTYLTKRNADALGASGLKFTPGWSVGYYFIPIMAFWKPYQALKETFQASHPDFRDDWECAPSPGVLPVWWTLFLIDSFVGREVAMTAFRAKTITEVIAASKTNLWSKFPDIALVVAVYVLISTLQTCQTAKFERSANPHPGSTDLRTGHPVKGSA